MCLSNLMSLNIVPKKPTIYIIENIFPCKVRPATKEEIKKLFPVVPKESVKGCPMKPPMEKIYYMKAKYKGE